MKAKGEYLLHQMGDAFFLIPSGQTLADRKQMLRLNESGAMLWELLQRETTEEELLDALCREYEGVERTQLNEDLNEFLDELREKGILW